MCYLQPQLRVEVTRPICQRRAFRSSTTQQSLHFFLYFLPFFSSSLRYHHFRFNRRSSLLSAVIYFYSATYYTSNWFFTLCVCFRVTCRVTDQQMGTKSRQRKVIFEFSCFPCKIACAINSFPSTCMSACWHDRFFSEWHLILDPYRASNCSLGNCRRDHIRNMTGGNKNLDDAYNRVIIRKLQREKNSSVCKVLTII